MPYGRFRKRRGKRKLYGQPIQHSPSLMANSPGNNIALVHVLAHADSLAGGSMSGARVGDEDRLTTVDNGRSVGKTTIQIDFTVNAGSTGYYEYAVIKYHRQTSVPVIGTDPLPTSTNIGTTGLQQQVRSLSPGWVLEWGTIPLVPGTNRSKILKINWAKYKMDKVKDGDYYCLIMFNRSDANNIYDIQVRYKTYTIT